MNEERLQREEHLRYILDTYGDLMYRMSLSIVGNREDAEDMVQDAILVYLKEAPHFPDEAHEKQWLVKVVRNESLMLVRKNRNHERILSDWSKVSVGKDADYGIMDALMSLPEKYRSVLVLFYVEEYSIEEIATVMGKTASAIKMRLKRGREMLSERVKNVRGEAI